MTHDEWEALCDGCGHCCAFVGTHIACPSFDSATNRCKNYENRFQVELCCEPVTPESVPRLHQMGVLPDSCAYVRHWRGEPQLDPKDVKKANLVPFTLMHPSEQARYILARSEWRKGRD